MIQSADISLMRDALAWQVELGADEAIGDTPINRLQPVDAPVPTISRTAAAVPQPAEPAIPDTAPLAAAAPDLPALRAALDAFDGCALKRGARNTVFGDGNPAARVMIVGEAPGREEDAAGRPFVGRSGQLLDRMFAAIGLARSNDEAGAALYITNVLPWRPPQNRDPAGDEIAMLTPFLHRHIALVAPDILVTMGNAATKTLLNTTTGITRMRGAWAAAFDIPVMPMLHPAALLRNPVQKREAWSDLLAIRERLDAQ